MSGEADKIPMGDATVHTVAAGDHLSAIAKRYGFYDFNQIWQDAANAKLRDKRKDPLQLVPGDQVAIPARHAVRYGRQTGQTHPFKVHVETLKLRLRLLDVAAKPLANTACVFEVAGATSELATDGAGFVEVEIPRDTARARLRVGTQTYDLGVGLLSPPSEDSANLKRLENLGFIARSSAEAVDDDDLALAVSDFQAEHGLAVTGKLDGPTRDKLVEQHGC